MIVFFLNYFFYVSDTYKLINEEYHAFFSDLCYSAKLNLSQINNALSGLRFFWANDNPEYVVGLHVLAW